MAKLSIKFEKHVRDQFNLFKLDIPIIKILS